MRLLFSTRPAFGHVYPLMPLANAARNAGHDVTFATADPFLERIAALGFATVEAGIDIEQGVVEMIGEERTLPRDEHGRPDVELGGRLFLDVVARHTVRDLTRVLQEHPVDVVIYEHYDVGAAVAAHGAGLPAVCHALSPRPADDTLAAFDAGRVGRLWSDAGVSAPSLDVFTGDVYLDIFPDGLQQRSVVVDRARLPLRPVPFAEPGSPLPGWIQSDRNRPLVYLTLGTVVATDDVLGPAIDGLASLDVDVVVALGSASGAALGELPSNVHPVTFIDQAALWPYVDLVVHHGGSGTMLGALTHAVPQLVLPKGADQFFNADALVTSGLADALDPSQATPGAIATFAERALAHDRPAVRAVQAELAARPHPADALTVLLDRVAMACHPA